jgi:formiminoglutamase
LGEKVKEKVCESTKLYSPGSPSFWTGRKDALPSEYLYQRVKILDLSKSHFPKIESIDAYALLGFQSDEGVKRNFGNSGAIDGPIFFRKYFSRLPIHSDFDFYDAGDIRCVGSDLESAQEELKQKVAKILHIGLVPVVIGGGHETAWGHYQGIHEHFGTTEPVAILNFDAHFDLRPLIDDKFGSSGTPFFQCDKLLKFYGQPFHYYCVGIQRNSNTKSLFEYANSNKVQYHLAEKINENPKDLNFVEKVIDQHEKIYITLCLDVFKASLAPGVSAPQPLGIGAEYVLGALKLLKKSKKVVSMDIVELSPRLDVGDRTAKLASSILMSYLDKY